MAELVTGYAGTEHITSAQAGLYNAGTIGTGKYILDTADGLACTVIDANTLQVAAGDALFEGRHVTVQSPETLTISSGTMGMNRVDLVAIHYERDGSGVETATLEIIEGTPTAGVPMVPPEPAGSILDGDADAYMGLWTVKISGLVPETPIQWAASAPGLVATTARIDSDVANVAAGLVPNAITASSLTFSNCSQFGASTPGYKIGRLVIINVRLTISGSSPTVSGFPAFTAANANVAVATTNTAATAYITTAGVLTISGVSSGNVMFSAVYVATS